MRALAGFSAAIALSALLGGCQSFGFGGAPTINGDTSIATTTSASPGSNEDFLINVGPRVFFGAGSATLNDVAKTTLDKQADWLSAYKGYRIVVEGFADEPGGAAYNKALGLKRAHAVQDYLVKKGVAAGRIDTASFGNMQPIRRCNEVSCWAQNRRAITVLQGDTGA